LPEERPPDSREVGDDNVGYGEVEAESEKEGERMVERMWEQRTASIHCLLRWTTSALNIYGERHRCGRSLKTAQSFKVVQRHLDTLKCIQSNGALLVATVIMREKKGGEEAKANFGEG